MKKLLLLLLSLIACLSCLFGCQLPILNGTASGKFEYKSGGEYSLIIDTEAAFDSREVYNKLIEVIGSTPELIGETQVASGTIVFGNTSNEASIEAMKYLNSRVKDEDTAAYLFYVHKGMLAVVYNNDIAIPEMLEYFYENYVLEAGLSLAADYKELKTFSISEYKDAEWTNRWDVYDGLISDGAIAAMKELYTLFNEDTYMWIASLYDPDIGAFYFSESARDNLGFLPDVESTRQVLTFMLRTGLAADFNNNLDEAIPDEISDKMVAFTKSLQDSRDGYFYHQQWGKDITVNRRGRDLTWSLAILKYFGESPNYPTPMDKYDVEDEMMSFAYEKAMPAPFGTSCAASVAVLTSSVVNASANEAPLGSAEELLEWMRSLDFANNSHTYGQIFSSQASVIKAAGYADVALDYLYEIQDPGTGHWESTPSWGSVGGLLKLSSAIANLGGVIHYPEKAIQSCMDVLLSDAPQTSMTGVYNCVNGSSNVMNSMNREGKNDEVKAIQAEMRENAEALILACLRKIVTYRNENGSFGYWEDRTSTHAQGALISLGVDDGELNGTLLATGSITGLISIMGLPTVRVYGPDDYTAFIDELLNAGKIVKSDPKPPEPIDFDSSSLGDDIPAELKTTINGSLAVIEDPRENKEGNVLEFTSASGAGDSVNLQLTRVSSAAANCFVLEADMNFARISDNCNAEPIQLYLRAGESSSKSIYMMTFNVKDGMVRFYDSSYGDSDGFRTDLGISIPVGEWFNLRIEYYPNKDENDKSDPRIKIFVTDEDGNTYEKISTNYFGPRLLHGTNQPEPVSDYLWACFYAVKAADMTLLIDDIYADRTADVYEIGDYTGVVGGGTNEDFFNDIKSPNAKTENNGSVIDFEDFDTESNLIGWSKNTNMLATVYSGTGIEKYKVSGDEDNQYLELNKTVKGGASVLVFKAAEGEENANCYVFEADIDWRYSSLGSGLQIGLSSGSTYTLGSEYCPLVTTMTSNTKYNFFGSTINSDEAVTTGTLKYTNDAFDAIASGKKYTVRMELYKDVGVAKLYINGTLCCETTDVGDEDFNHVVIYMTSSFIGTVRIDNVLATKIAKEYVPGEAVGDPTPRPSEISEN